MISDVQGAAVPRGELEASGVSVIAFDPPLGVDVILEFHDDTPCAALTIDVCNLEDEGPFELGRGVLECDPESSLFSAEKAADVTFSSGCPDGPWHHWRATSGKVHVAARDDVVHLDVSADMVPEFSGDSGTFTIRATAEIDPDDVDPVGD